MIFAGVSHVNSKCWCLGIEGNSVSVPDHSWWCECAAVAPLAGQYPSDRRNTHSRMGETAKAAFKIVGGNEIFLYFEFPYVVAEVGNSWTAVNVVKSKESFSISSQIFCLKLVFKH